MLNFSAAVFAAAAAADDRGVVGRHRCRLAQTVPARCQTKRQRRQRQRRLLPDD